MMSSTVEISVIILFKQKDEKFQQALKSAQFAKEIITLKNNQITDFSQIRNQALKKATQKWVFFLDSDEVIAPKSVAEIKEIIQDDLADGVMICRQDVFYHQVIKHGEAGSIKLLRMGKRDKMSWQRPVHEVATISGTVEDSNIKIIHQAHSSLTSFITSVISYAGVEAKYRTSLNKNPSVLQLITFPIIKFIHNYLLKKGFLDGWRGLIYALIMSLHSFSVRVFQYELKYCRNHEKNI
jgi:glycosyltransferase involved in cell wall biosynthesis